MDGLAEMLSNIDRWEQRKIDAARDGMREVTEMVMAESWDLCPVSPTDPNHEHYTGHPGNLQQSGYASEPKIEGNSIVVEMGYNAKTADGRDYAAAVHERTAVNHRYPGASNPKAQAKFLSVPLIRARHKAMPIIAEKVKNA